MHACARGIHLPHAFFHLAVGQVLVFRGVGAAARELGRQICIDKQIKRPPVLKYARCAAANDDAVSPLGQRADDAPLSHEQLERLLGNRRIGGKAAPEMQRKARGHAPAEQVFHIPFAGIRLAGQFFQNLAVVISKAQAIAQPFAQFAAAAAKFTADSDDARHRTSLPLRTRGPLLRLFSPISDKSNYSLCCIYCQGGRHTKTRRSFSLRRV